MLVRTPTGQKALLKGLRAPWRALGSLGTTEGRSKQRNGPRLGPNLSISRRQSRHRGLPRPNPPGFDFGSHEAHTAPLPQIGSARSPLLQPDEKGGGASCHAGDATVAAETRRRSEDVG